MGQSKPFLGSLIKIAGGAIQYEKDGDFECIVVTGRHDPIKIPVDQLQEALEDQWVFDAQERYGRKFP